jgi:F0F1-type ATP synthase assembly protein I
MKSQIIKVLILQYGLGGVYLAAAGLWDLASIISAMAGCMAGLAPKTYFSLRMLRTTEDKDAQQWLGYAYRSEIGKWMIMVSIFMIAFGTDYHWDYVILFAGFVIIQMSGWLAPFVISCSTEG